MSNNYTEIVNLLTSAGKFRISLGLDRMYKILELLDNPQDDLEYIHVAGTNGKGSVCAILSSILISAGKKVGLYTSPHLFKYNERIKISGCAISDEDFVQYVKSIITLSDKNNIDLTEFEILTAVMFKYFSDNNVDVVVLETGLGGRYDATNVINKNLCSIITHVDLDHTERLGNTISEIAYEKAGIIKPNCPCIVFEGLEVYKDITSELNSLLMVILPFADTQNLSLKGFHQQENLALALAAVELVFPEIQKNVIELGLSQVKHPARFQFIKSKNLLVDGAHNPNGINSLCNNLNMYYPEYQRRFIFGCLKNKNYKSMVNNLFYPDDEIYFYQFNHNNSASYKELSEACKIASKELLSSQEIDFNDGKLNIICGSLYMIPEVLEKFFPDVIGEFN